MNKEEDKAIVAAYEAFILASDAFEVAHAAYNAARDTYEAYSDALVLARDVYRATISSARKALEAASKEGEPN